MKVTVLWGAAVGAVGALAFAASPARACDHWSVPATWEIAQGNNITVYVADVGQDGTVFKGHAEYLGPIPPSAPFMGHDPAPIIKGALEGEINGERVTIRVYWQNRTMGIYSGAIHAGGRMEGINYDRDHPGTKVGWYARTDLTCVAAPAPPAAPRPPTAQGPIRHIGKGRPAADPPTTTSATGPVRHIGHAPPSSGQASACLSGYVWRQAGPGDFACVTSYSRARAALDNSRAAGRVDPAGAYGPDTCVSGYVWREAFEGDHVCVTPDVRSQTAEENRLAPMRHVQE